MVISSHYSKLEQSEGTALDWRKARNRMANVPPTRTTPAPQGKSLALQVPANINLEKMSTAEIEKLAIEMSQKVAAAAPKNSTVLGVDRLVLTNRAKADVGVEVTWTRDCGSRDLAREGIAINPEAFSDPVQIDVAAHPSTKVTVERANKA
jgi:hypothetical protein